MKLQNISNREVDYLIEQVKFLNIRGKSLFSKVRNLFYLSTVGRRFTPKYTTSWAAGGKMIDAENVAISQLTDGKCTATMHMPHYGDVQMSGAAPLEAAMKVIVYKHFGEYIPDANVRKPLIETDMPFKTYFTWSIASVGALARNIQLLNYGWIAFWSVVLVGSSVMGYRATRRWIWEARSKLDRMHIDHVTIMRNRKIAACA